MDGCCDHLAGIPDEELHRYTTESIAQADALLFGRVTYEMMEKAWRQWLRGDAARLDAGLDGAHETEQLGFRMAAMFNHPRVHPIDHRGAFPFGAVMEYAQVHDSAFVTFVGQERARISAEANRQQKESTIGEILRLSNEPTNLARDHGTYMRSGRVGAGDTYVGAALLSKWYERNIHIFANLRRIAEPGDRLLVIIGSGHAPIVRDLVTYDPGMLLVDVLEYLPPE